jgi:hypothetical protein
MKKTVSFYFLLVLMPLGLYSQADSIRIKTQAPAKHELGTSLYALSIKPGDFYSQYNYRLDNYLFNGLYYKCYTGKSALRCSFNYFRKLAGYKHGSYGSYLPSRSFQAAVGYQRLLGKGSKTAPYVFADASCSLQRETRSQESYYYPYYYLASSYLANPYYDTYIANSYQAAISPGIGLRVHLGKNLVLNLEAALQFFYEVENHSYKSIGISARPFQCQLGFMF